MSEKNVYKKLAEARVKLQKRDLKKSGQNAFAKYKYYELSDFLPSINEIFNELGLVSTFQVDLEQGKLTIINADNPSEELVFTAPYKDIQMKGTNEIQNVGSVITYLRRYLYMNALEIVESDFSETQTANKETQVERINNYEVKKIKDLYSADEIKGMLQRLKVKALTDLTKEQAQQMIGARDNVEEIK